MTDCTIFKQSFDRFLNSLDTCEHFKCVQRDRIIIDAQLHRKLFVERNQYLLDADLSLWKLIETWFYNSNTKFSLNSVTEAFEADFVAAFEIPLPKFFRLFVCKEYATLLILITAFRRNLRPIILVGCHDVFVTLLRNFVLIQAFIHTVSICSLLRCHLDIGW